MQLSQNSNLSPIKFYELELIHKMCRGDEEKIAKMMAVFINQITQFIQDVRTAYSDNDFSRMERLVHKIKPTLTYFGTSTLEKEFLYLEDLLLMKSESSEIELKIRSISTLIKKIVDEMKNDFKIIN